MSVNDSVFVEMIQNLEDILCGYKDPVIAVSGGVDSMTLSCFSHRILGNSNVRMVHAKSPAVPQEATRRLQSLAKLEGWDLQVINVGEFSEKQYLDNPINRCFFCKTYLYKGIREFCGGTILSGTNVDDLEDFRPGLEAAANAGVRHPYVEAGFKKQDLRLLAQQLGLDSIAELPSSPCLSSRVETGIPIEAADLRAIDFLESFIQKNWSPKSVRCRVRSEGIVIELDEKAFKLLSGDVKQTIVAQVLKTFPQYKENFVKLAEYRKGSAFVDREAPLSHG